MTNLYEPTTRDLEEADYRCKMNSDSYAAAASYVNIENRIAENEIFAESQKKYEMIIRGEDSWLGDSDCD